MRGDPEGHKEITNRLSRAVSTPGLHQSVRRPMPSDAHSTMVGLVMPRTLLQSVVGTLQNEQRRLEDELNRVTAALTAFGKVYLKGSKSKPAASRGKRTI